MSPFVLSRLILAEGERRLHWDRNVGTLIYIGLDLFFGQDGRRR